MTSYSGIGGQGPSGQSRTGVLQDPVETYQRAYQEAGIGGLGAETARWMTLQPAREDIEHYMSAATAQWEPTAVSPEQQAMMEMLRARAAGEAGPSAAEMQLQRSREQNIAALMAARASQRGMAPGAAERQLGAQMAQETQVASGQAAQLRAREQLAAEQMYAQMMMQQRQQELEQDRIRAELAMAEAEREQRARGGFVGAVGEFIGTITGGIGGAAGGGGGGA